MASMVNLATEFALENGSVPRRQATGLNSNVWVQDTQFHVQTEDLGPEPPQIVTHVFDALGRVVQVVRIDYTKHLGKPNLQQLLPKVMTVHHGTIISRLQRTSPIEGGATANLQPSTSSVSGEQAARCDNEDEGERRSGTFKVAARAVWDRLVAAAQRERRCEESASEGPIAGAECLPPVLSERSAVSVCPWDLAVESRRHGKPGRNINDVRAEADQDAAAEAYATGLERMHLPDKTLALASFARAVELDPHHPRYRAGLRHALDWIDRFERVAG